PYIAQDFAIWSSSAGGGGSGAPASCANPGLTSSPNAGSLLLGTSQTFTASATCGGTPVYKWWVGTVSGSNISWTQMAQFSTTNTFAWTPATAGSYLVAFWVKNQDGTDGWKFDTFTQIARTVNI